MARTPKYTVAQVEKALRKSAGVISIAAQKLGCTRQCVEYYLKKHKRLREAKEDCTEELLDMCDAVVIEEVRKRNMTAVIWAQKTLGKHRGYTERFEHTGKGGKDLPPVVVNIASADVQSSSKTG